MLDRSKLLILLLLGLGVAAAGAAVTFRYYQGRRALELWGAEHAGRIRNASKVTAVRFAEMPTLSEKNVVGPDGRLWAVTSEVEVGSTPDFFHVRQAFLRDAYFDWEVTEHPTANWKYALRFVDSQGETSMILIDGAGSEVCLLATGVRATMNEGLLASIRKFLDDATAREGNAQGARTKSS